MNITDPIRHRALLAPQSPAVVQPGLELTYREFDRAVDALAARLAGRGLAQGDTVGILARTFSNHQALLLVLALSRLGVAWASGVDAIAPCEAAGMDFKAHLAGVRGAGEFSPRAAPFVTAEPGWFETPRAAQTVPPMRSSPGGEAVCAIFSSSGTTGTPKAIALTHAMLARRTFRRSLGLRLPGDLRQACILGVMAAYGFASFLRVLWSGGTVVMTNVQDEALPALQRYQVNYLVASPANLQGLLAILPEDAGPLASLRVIEAGGSLLPPRLAAQVRKRLCPDIVVSYGSTEATPIASAPLSVLAGQPRAVGHVLPGVEVQAVDESGTPVPAGEEGIIRVRSDTCVSGYVGDAQASAGAFRDGWFYPGDLGSVSGDGLLSILGRVTEVINAGGVKVSPQVIEEVLLSREEITDAAAFGVANARGMTRIGAAVVAREPVNVEALLAFCRARLEKKAPRFIVQVPRLPRNENGKVARRELMQLIASLDPRPAAPRAP